MPTKDCGACNQISCGNQRLSDKDLRLLMARLLCEVADNTAGGGGGGGAAGTEAELLVDEGDSDTVFLRVYDITDPQAAPATFTDYNLDGTAHALVGPVSPLTSGGGSSGAIAVEEVTVTQEAFSPMRAMIPNNSGGGGMNEVNLSTQPGGGTQNTYSGVFTAQPSALEYSPDYTQVWGIVGNNLEIVDLATRLQVSSTAITGTLAGLGGNIYTMSYNYHTGEMWVYYRGGSSEFHTITAGAVTALKGSTDFGNTMIANGGFDWLPDGRMVACGAGIGTQHELVELVPKLASASAAVDAYNKGPTIFDGANYGLRSPMSITGRGTVVADSIDDSSGFTNIGEYTLAGTEISKTSIGTIHSGGAVSVFNPFLDDRIHVGANIRRVTVTDATGTITSTRYFLEDGTEVTSNISGMEQYVTARLDTQSLTDERQAEHLFDEIAFGSLAATLTDTGVILAQGRGCRTLQIINTTDVKVYFGWTSGELTPQDHFVVPAGATHSIDYGANGEVAVGSLMARYGSVPTEGEVIIMATRRTNVGDNY